MITKIKFDSINSEVQKAVSEIYSELKKLNPEGYIMFLADCEYEKRYDNKTTRFSPYVLDYVADKLKDQSRITFLTSFLQMFYSFPPEKDDIDNNELRLQMELMVYTHIWESKAFLKDLFRLSHLLNGENYDWKVKVPDMTKHDFIRNEVRAYFLKSKKVKSIGDIMTKGYHSSLRNAFAHSEYSFDTMNKNQRIILHNYKGKDSWELKLITFDDWSLRFVYSALLNYYILKEKLSRRQNIITDFGMDIFEIPFPPKAQRVKIQYHKTKDSFNYVRS